MTVVMVVTVVTVVTVITVITVITVVTAVAADAHALEGGLTDDSGGGGGRAEARGDRGWRRQLTAAAGQRPPWCAGSSGCGADQRAVGCR